MYSKRRSALALVIVLGGLHASVWSARAANIVEASVEVLACTLVKDEKERLACFDRAALGLAKANVPDAPATASTKELVTAFTPGDFKVVDPDDVHVAPRKFVGKPIELRGVRCFYADKDDYRCIAPSRMATAVFARSIGPADEKDAFENNCGAIKKLESPACRKTIRLVPTDYDQDRPNPITTRMVIKAATIEIVRAGAKAKR